MDGERGVAGGEGAMAGGLDPWALLRSLPDVVVVIDERAGLLWGNDVAERWSGWQLADLVGRPMHTLVHPDDLHTALVSLDSVQGKDVGTSVELRLRDRAGTYSRFEVRGRSAVAGGIVLVLRDTTERRRWEVAAGDSSLLQAVVDSAPAITMLLDGDGCLRGASRALTTILGRALSGALGSNLADLAVEDDAATVRAELALAAAGTGSRTFEARFTATTGAVPLSVTVANLLDDRAVAGLVVTAVDITALVDARDRLVHLAGHDQLTGLVTRALLFERLEQALASARRTGGEVSVLYCDLDGFKQVNDVHGHAAGDHVLVTQAARLAGVVRAADTVARIGGDELVVVATASAAEAAVLVRRVTDALSAPIRLLSGTAVVVPASCGVATAGGDASADELLGLADAAMYLEKRPLRRGGAMSLVS